MPTERQIEQMMVRLNADPSQYKKAMKDAADATNMASGHVQLATKRIEAFGLRLRGFGASATALVLPIVGAFEGVQSIFSGVRLEAEAEQMEIAFTSIVGDAGRAQKGLEDIRKFAAETPFEMPELVSASKQMMAMGTEVENIIPTMRQLGDVASGLSIPIGELAYVFGTLQSQGRAQTEDINQFATRGIPIWQELEKITGKNNAQVRKMVEQGQIGFPQVEQAFKNMTSEGGKFGGGMEKQSKSLLGLFSTMKDGINTALRGIGKTIIEEFDLKGVVATITEGAERAAKWFAAISPEAKKAAAAIVIVTVTLGVMLGMFALIKVAVTLAFGGLNIVVGLVVLGVTTLVASLAGLVVGLGGVAGTLAVIKQKAAEAWEWLGPVRQALSSFWETTVGIGKQLWSDFQDFMSNLWKKITGDSQVNWERIRQVIVNAILFAEFTIQNFGKAMDIVWVFAQLKFVQFADSLEHFFTNTMPVILNFFKDNWFDILKGIFTFHMEMMRNTVQNTVTMFTSIPDLIKGDMSLEDLSKQMVDPFQSGLKDALKKMPELPKRQTSILEQQLQGQMDKMTGAFEEGFWDFQQKKLAEFGGDGIQFEEVNWDEFAGAGKKAGDAFNQNVAKEVKKLDAVLTGSAESLARIAEYRDMLARGKSNDNKRGSPGVNSFEAASKASAEAESRQEKNRDVLVEIRELMKKQVDKPGLNVGVTDMA